MVEGTGVRDVLEGTAVRYMVQGALEGTGVC